MAAIQSNISGARLPTRVGGFLGRLLTLLAGSLFLVVGVTFSLLALSIVVIAILLAFVYFKWKARTFPKDFPRRFRQSGEHHGKAPTDGRVIEGELIGTEYDRREADARAHSLRAP